MVPERPEVPRIRATRAGGGLDGAVKVEGFDAVALLGDLEGLQERTELVLGEAGQAEIEQEAAE